MAIIPNTQFPGKTAGTNANYPYGQARDVASPGDGTGTPWVAALANDLFGFQQALLQAAGITPSGSPDTAVASQYLQALFALTRAEVTSDGVTIPAASGDLIVKWGFSSVSTGINTLLTHSFPEAFPTECLYVLTHTKTSVTTGAGAGKMAQLVDFNASGFRWYNDAWETASAGIQCGFIAFGR